MHVILTHEQADFDALAALLGAHILNEHAIPVLPRRMNRNIRTFLNLYQDQLPFVEARDLPAEEIETVTLVDTQALITLKGMSGNTQVHVVDHHSSRDDLPADWTLVGEKLGAITTLFVEEIQDHNGPLKPLQSTVLLLGIYEDTGSLTYANTTPRDVRAVAYLLEQGASLKVAGDYLNPPLSESQQAIYNRLLANSETLPLQGQNVVVATADAGDMSDEISTIAHKMRDLLDPDAIFLLVNTNEGVRLVARSTTNRINVAAVAAQFGGGGHDRAAAALIKATSNDRSAPSLAENYQKLMHILPAMIEPAVTVGKIMSRGARVLDPETPAKEAARLMQRYGYEGYPVVREGKVVGLLTRRAVDRALSHKLNLTAGSLMDAGEITISPREPVEHLQHLMAETGWGQIPVVDPENDEIIGIVTRTDLLKLIGGSDDSPLEHKNLASRIEQALPAARLAFLKIIAEKAHEHHIPVYVVGGFVRDLILDRPSLDFDIVVEGDAIALGKALQAQYSGRLVSHARFGTAKWQISAVHREMLAAIVPGQPFDKRALPASLDLISARTEFYNYPTALPTVEQGSIKLDLHRRDFTINTLAMRLDGRHFGVLYDFWGGLLDLQKGLVRVLHSLSFVDDPTRMLRAVRFEKRFGFRIETRTLQLMSEAHDLLKQVSGDRIRHELDLILSEGEPAATLDRLQELDLLEAIQPGLYWESHYSEALETALKGEIDPAWSLPEALGSMPLQRALGYLVWLLPQAEAIGPAICQRLRLPQVLANNLQAGQKLLPELEHLPGLPASRLVQRLDEVPLPALYAIYCLAEGEGVRQAIANYSTNLKKIQPLTDGYTLQAMGVVPGPVYRQILWSLRAARLDGKVFTREQEQALLNQLLNTRILN